MRMDGRRRSGNVDDRRRMGAGMGIGGKIGLGGGIVGVQIGRASCRERV